MNSRFFFRSAFCVALLVIALSAASSARSGVDNGIKGTVTRQGRPLRSAWVIATQNGNERGRALTGDDGRYYIGALPDGGYEIAVEQNGRLLLRTPINLPANNRYDIVIR